MGRIETDPARMSPIATAAECVPSGRAPRIVLYSHDTLGFGHVRRNILLAEALKMCGHDPDILLIAGMREAGAFALPPGVDALSLPAYAKAQDGTYKARDLDVETKVLRDMRAAIIRASVEKFKPDMVVVDNVPRGAQHELDPTLRSLKRSGGARIVLGLRDIIDRPAVMRRQWLRQRNFEALSEFYSDIWVYGDPQFYATAKEYGLGPDLSARVTYTGYLDQRARFGSTAAFSDGRAIIDGDNRPYVLCTVGGGRDGVALSAAFAQAEFPDGHRGIIITGSQMPEDDKSRIRNLVAGRSDMTVVEFVQEPVELVARAAALVSMCGYNTACEIMSLGVRALVIPRIRPRAEQTIRAERLWANGIADMMHPEDLSPAKISRWLLQTPAPSGSRHAFDLNGLDKVKAIAASAFGPIKTVRCAS